MEIDSIIFDLDGTLWDTTRCVCDIINELIKDYHGRLKPISVQQLRECMGLTMDEISRVLFPELEESERPELIEQYNLTENRYLAEHGGVLYPGVEETVGLLSRKYKLFIVSNCQDGYIESFLKAHGMKDYFTDFECHGRTGQSKGENNKTIISRNALKSPIYVGDTDGDAKSAAYAGIPFVFAGYGFGHTENYDFYIDRFEDIVKLDCLK